MNIVVRRDFFTIVVGEVERLQHVQLGCKETSGERVGEAKEGFLVFVDNEDQL